MEKGDAGAIAGVAALLENEHFGVRTAALKTLGAIVEKGDVGIIARVTRLLEDTHVGVRAAAADTLGQIVLDDSEVLKTPLGHHPK